MNIYTVEDRDQIFLKILAFFFPTTISLLQKQVLLQNDVNKSEFWVLGSGFQWLLKMHDVCRRYKEQ
jgi:hypothetical protein